MLSRGDRAQVVKEFPEHLARMRKCLADTGRIVSDSDIALAWARYSDSLCASWLEPPHDDIALTETLLRYLPQTDAAAEGAFRARLEDADDDTGDAILELPLQCLDRLGWEIGDTLSISQDAQGRLILRRISDEEV
ncbi:hypothetical protein [Burkholderia sp. KCJ3K979]|uniref:hypothetical protein n=1 Tax=Burkholderia sp. KCJ3K979 TaxID=2759149 RepID=UPI001929AE02|nr:hypothetical protein [Burkholderia sp. KCJ3K979]